jgi:hypothetical protein
MISFEAIVFKSVVIEIVFSIIKSDI